MSITHKVQVSITSSSGIQSQSGSDTEVPASEISGQVSFPANSVNTAFSLACNAARLQDVFLVANQNCTINTVGTNSTMLTLTAGMPFYWGTSLPAGSPYPTNPFTGTVNSATLTCNTATQLRFLLGTS